MFFIYENGVFQWWPNNPPDSAWSWYTDQSKKKTIQPLNPKSNKLNIQGLGGNS